ncbi:MAG: hypothetical protein AAB510_02700 [Patescibacteria group bacterium]
MPESLGNKKTLYREPEIQAEVKRISDEIFESKEISKKTAANFFGLGISELTAEEMERFRLYVEHASKRLLNGNMHIPGREVQNKEQAVGLLRDALVRGSLIFHDVSHVMINTEDQREDNNIVPAFLRLGEVTNSRELIAEEPRALMWVTIWGKHPIFISLLDEERKKDFLKDYVEKIPDFAEKNSGVLIGKIINAVNSCDSTSFDSVFNAYQTIVYETVRVSNQKIFSSGEEKSEQEIYEMNKDYDAIVTELRANPDPRLVETAKTVFGNYDKNPKVLFEEFERICGPLLENLQKRKKKN